MQFKEQFLKKLSSAKKLVFFTGAGISAESGIATFRGADGIWNKMKPEELASFNAFMKNPDLVWEWYQHRREIIHKVEPNAAHLTIAELEQYYEVTVVTQNVDNLHKRAGSSLIYELHGNIERNFCVDCHTFVNEQQFTGPLLPPPQAKLLNTNTKAMKARASFCSMRVRMVGLLPRSAGPVALRQRERRGWSRSVYL